MYIVVDNVYLQKLVCHSYYTNYTILIVLYYTNCTILSVLYYALLYRDLHSAKLSDQSVAPHLPSATLPQTRRATPYYGCTLDGTDLLHYELDVTSLAPAGSSAGCSEGLL